MAYVRMKVDRREFVFGTMALTALASFGKAAAGRPLVKLGVVSDIHVADDTCRAYRMFVKALEYFRSIEVDGVLIPGDLADLGRTEQLEAVIAAWEKVFPSSRLPNGEKVEKLFVFGNHDDPKMAGSKRNIEWAKEKHGDKWAEHLIACDPKAAWERIIKEPYAPVFAKRVRGFVFIGCHWGHEKEVDAFLKAHETELGLKGGKPFFYAQHPHPLNTVNSAHGAYSWGHDRGDSTRALSRYPNAVAFSGHSHYPLTNDQTIWQGAFTSVGGASTSYLGWLSGRDNGEWPTSEKPGPVPVGSRLGQKGCHALVLSVYDDRMVFERRDLEQNAALGPDWVCPLPACVDEASRPYSFAASEARAKVPQFAADAKVTVSTRSAKDRLKRTCDQMVVSFPSARSDGPTGRLIEYEVTVENLHFGFTRIHTQKRVMAAGHVYADESAVKTDECAFALSELPENADIRFVIRPLNAFGHAGRPIMSEVMKRGEKK